MLKLIGLLAFFLDFYLKVTLKIQLLEEKNEKI
jgi:hypothetical protein